MNLELSCLSSGWTLDAVLACVSTQGLQRYGFMTIESNYPKRRLTGHLKALDSGVKVLLSLGRRLQR